MHPRAHDCEHCVATRQWAANPPVQMFVHNYSPLHLAAKRGHLGVCRLLLAANAGPSPFEPRAHALTGPLAPAAAATAQLRSASCGKVRG